MEQIKNFNILSIITLILFFSFNLAFAGSFTAEPRVQAFINELAGKSVV